MIREVSNPGGDGHAVFGFTYRGLAVLGAGFGAILVSILLTVIVLSHQGQTNSRLNRQTSELNGQTARLNTLAITNCANISALAAISADELAAQLVTNRTLLPRANIPGITHAELLRLSKAKEGRERKHVAELRAVAAATCAAQPPAPEKPLGVKLSHAHRSASVSPSAAATSTTLAVNPRPSPPPRRHSAPRRRAVAVPPRHPTGPPPSPAPTQAPAASARTTTPATIPQPTTGGPPNAPNSVSLLPCVPVGLPEPARQLACSP